MRIKYQKVVLELPRLFTCRNLHVIVTNLPNVYNSLEKRTVAKGIKKNNLSLMSDIVISTIIVAVVMKKFICWLSGLVSDI